jgi:hypothetical protein
MDVVYILGKGSVWQDNEIRYSLRSIYKNLIDLDNVYIIGEKPPWVKNINHISCPDPYPIKWKNGYYKIKKACEIPDLSNDFLLMNDDFFIMKKILAKNYPYYYNGILTTKTKHYSKKFLTTWETTAKRLKKNKKRILNFSIHRPFVYNKNMFLNLPEIPIDILGFSVRSFYANYYNLPARKSIDPITMPGASEKDLNNLIAKYTDFSITSSTAREKWFRLWLHGQFPLPSVFE